MIARLAGVVLAATCTSYASAQCSWDAVAAGGVGPSNSVYAVAEWDPDGPGGPLPTRLVVGGNFTSVAGNSSIKQLASFDGTSWSGFGTFFSPGGTAAVLAITSLANGDLIVGGEFQTVNGMPARYIARYNSATATWFPMGPGTGGGTDFLAVRALATTGGGDVIVGGDFTVIGGVQCGRIARWSPLPAPTGTFTPLNNGSGAGGVFGGNVYSVLALSNGDIIAAGSFTSLWAASGRGIGRYQASNNLWTSYGPGPNPGIFGTVLSVFLHPQEGLIAGGGFTIANGAPQDNIARFDGVNWVSVAGGMNGSVTCLGVDSSGVLVAGGLFTIAGGGANGTGSGAVPANRIARIQGNAWAPMANGPGAGGVYSVPAAGGSAVYGLHRFLSGDLFAGGFFTTAGNPDGSGGVSANYVAKWSCNTPPCLADFNGMNGVTVQDIFDFLAAWFAQAASADINGVDGVTVQDIFDFLGLWFGGC